MKGLIVSIVDILGILIPGFLLLLGILVFPPVANDLCSHWQNWSAMIAVIKDNLATIGILCAIVSYVLGFLIRLWSISILQIVTCRCWCKKLKKRATELETALTEALKNDTLTRGLKAEAGLHARCEVANVAPYFQFAKRIIQNGNPNLWAASERLDAELRFVAGIFFPLLLLAADGVKIASFAGYTLAVVSAIGALITLQQFPAGRIREVIYTYQMALIVLHYPTQSSTHSTGDA